MWKRCLDVTLVCLALPVALPLVLLIAVAVRYSSPGPILHWSKRIGQDNSIFRMPKFRSMQIDAPQVATHLLHDSTNWITPIGRLLRKTSLDELPQLWSVLRGQMSLVGPRPALFNQHDLIDLRTQAGIHRLKPGLTGYAQINGRDELPIPKKVQLDAFYAERKSLALDLAIIATTAWKVVKREGVCQADGSSSADAPVTGRKAA